MNAYDNMMLDLLLSSKSASNCQNNTENKKKSFCKNCCMERRPTAQ